MASQAVLVMRAFRSIDSSYHVWRAGEFDDDMSETTPPNPPGEYSDHTVIGYIGGPLARSDEEAFELAGMGTSGAPVTFSTTPGATFETVPGTDCRDFTSITYWVVVTTPGTATEVRVFVAWTGLDAAIATDFSTQKSDDQIAAGLSPQNIYQGQFTIPTPDTGPVGPFNVPVRGRRARFAVQSDTGDLQGYVLAMRLA